MTSISMIFVLMMLPGLALLATSFIVSYFESEPAVLVREFTDKFIGCWKAQS